MGKYAKPTGYKKPVKGQVRPSKVHKPRRDISKPRKR